MLRDSVIRAFPAFTRKFEGLVLHFYLDVKGLVTIGLGNLQDPIVSPLLDFRHKVTGELAEHQDVMAEWAHVKALQALREKGGAAFEEYTRFECTEESLDELVQGELLHFEAVLKSFFPDLEQWPADAQLGLLSMAWAMGPYFPRTWPHFRTACEAWQWEIVAQPHGSPASCQMREEGQNASFRMRNQANHVLFCNAAQVAARALSPEKLYWPAAI